MYVQFTSCVYGDVSQIRNSLTAFQNHSLIKIAPGHCFGVTLATLNRKSTMISYNWELNDFSLEPNKYGIIFTWFRYKFRLRKKTLEENIILHGPRPPQPQKITADLKLYFKLSSLQQRTNQILPATIKKFSFCLVKETASCSFRI